LDAPPNFESWNGAASAKWVPPACSGWHAAPAVLLVTLAGHFTNPGDVSAILSRVGNISALTAVRYWSVTDKEWEALFTRATGLRGPDANTPRADFSAAEFRGGTDLYFLSNDNRTQKDLVTRLRIRDLRPERIVLEMTNVSPLRWLAFTVVPPGDLQTLYFLDRQSDGSWRFYSATRVLNASFLLSRLVTGPSYVNRAVAMYRHIAGIPTEREPPAAP
jgi:hypothetical protein